MTASSSQKLGTASLLLGAVLFALAIGEGAVRLLKPGLVQGPDPIRNPFWRYDPDIGWSHMPGSEGTFSRKEFRHRVRINSAGWRDRERVLPKPAGVFRVAVLGDSFTWGHGVDDDKVYTRVLERIVGGVEVLNFGLSGSSTDQQLLILKRHVLAYQPDLVLLMVTRNDFFDTGRRRVGSYPKPMFVLSVDGALHLTNVPVPEVSWLRRFHYRLRRHLGLLNLVEGVFRNHGNSLPASAAASPAADRYRLMRALLMEMHDQSAGAGAAFAICVTAMGAHTYPDEIPREDLERLEMLQHLARSEAIPLLNLVPGFRSAARNTSSGRPDVLHYPEDLHWTIAGHRLAAKELARLLKEKGLVPVGREPRLGGLGTSDP